MTDTAHPKDTPTSYCYCPACIGPGRSSAVLALLHPALHQPLGSVVTASSVPGIPVGSVVSTDPNDRPPVWTEAKLNTTDPGEGWRLLKPEDVTQEGDQYQGFGHSRWYQAETFGETVANVRKRFPACVFRRRVDRDVKPENMQAENLAALRAAATGPDLAGLAAREAGVAPKWKTVDITDLLVSRGSMTVGTLRAELGLTLPEMRPLLGAAVAEGAIVVEVAANLRPDEDVVRWVPTKVDGALAALLDEERASRMRAEQQLRGVEVELRMTHEAYLARKSELDAARDELEEIRATVKADPADSTIDAVEDFIARNEKETLRLLGELERAQARNAALNDHAAALSQQLEAVNLVLNEHKVPVVASRPGAVARIEALIDNLATTTRERSEHRAALLRCTEERAALHAEVERLRPPPAKTPARREEIQASIDKTIHNIVTARLTPPGESETEREALRLVLMLQALRLGVEEIAEAVKGQSGFGAFERGLLHFIDDLLSFDPTQDEERPQWTP